ncbi:MAG TPA: PAS domain S-box protein [Lutibacter sp.]|nr:PAS domain S-box protein [Lutibacter sp.]
MSAKLTKADRPNPINEEIKIDDEAVLISVTDPKGIIREVNDVFIEIAGYNEEELIGAPHNIIRHPDMPQVMFKIVWEHIKDRENVMALVKNLAKDGRYYWILTDFVTKVDASREVVNYTAYRRPICKDVQNAITPLYKALCAIEDIAGMEASEKFLGEYLENKGMTYDEMIEDIIVKHCKKAAALGFGNQMADDFKTMSTEKKQSFWNKLFGIK